MKGCGAMRLNVGNFNIYIAKDYDEMSKIGAGIMASQVLLKPNSTLGFATGSTPIGMYKELIRLHKEGILDFSDVTTYNLDEYYPIKRSNDQSYFYFMHENLFNHINLKSSNINVPNGEVADIQNECDIYEKKLRESGIDMQLLGIGNNGHIAFNEPGDAFDDATHVVTLTQSTIEANSRFFNNASEVPTQAVSMGIGSIMTAKRLLFLAHGAHKAAAVKEMLYGSITPQMPASAIRMHRKVDIVLTKDIYELL